MEFEFSNMESELQINITAPPQRGYFQTPESMYFLFVFVLFYLLSTLYIIPSWMKSRDAFSLKTVMIVYNIIQIVLNGLSGLKIGEYVMRTKMSFLCSEVDFSNREAQDLHSFYLMLKCLDLIDTVIFAFRKKMGQISFLHVYHHAGMVICPWITYIFCPGGQAIYPSFMNSFVHVFMYAYYLVTALNPKMRQNLTWKKRLTELQIAHQVVAFFIFCGPLILDNCQYPKTVCWVAVFQGTVFITLFTQFYINNYIKSKRKNM